MPGSNSSASERDAGAASASGMSKRSPSGKIPEAREIAKSPQKTALLLLNRHGVSQYVGMDIGKNEG